MSFLSKLLNNLQSVKAAEAKKKLKAKKAAEAKKKLEAKKAAEAKKKLEAKKAAEAKKKLKVKKKIEAEKILDALRIEARWELRDKELKVKKDIYKPKILYIDKDSASNSIGEILEYHGFEVQKSQSGIKGQRLAEQFSPDLILLTSKLPDIDGFTLCYRLKKRERTLNIPTLMMLDFSDEFEIFMMPGFKFLVGDHIKPLFIIEELCARIRHLLHIKNRNSLYKKVYCYDEEILYYGPLKLVPETFEAIWFGSRIRLTLFEFELLFSLLQRRGQTVSIGLLLNEVWGYGFGKYDDPLYGYDKESAKIIRPLIRSLRMKLEPNPIKPMYIKTFYKKGYCLNIH